MEIFARNTRESALAYPKITNTQNVYNLLIICCINSIIKKIIGLIIIRYSNVLVLFSPSDVAQKTTTRVLPSKGHPNKAFSNETFPFKARPNRAIQFMARLFTRVDARTSAVSGAGVGNAGIDGRADGCSQCGESDEPDRLDEAVQLRRYGTCQ